MAANTRFVALSGSERKVVSGARWVGASHPDEVFQVTVHVRRKRNATGVPSDLSDSSRHLTHEELEQDFGADPADLERVADFARQHGLTVVESSVPKRIVKLSGTVQAFEAAFRVTLGRYEHPNFTYRGRTGPVMVPAELNGIITAVLGLDNRPVAKPHFVMPCPRPKGEFQAADTEIQTTGLSPVNVANLYGFPPGDGAGQSVGIIELGGGYRQADLDKYFVDIGTPSPNVIEFPVDNATNNPGPLSHPNSDNVEVMLDIEVVGAIVPKATIVVYFAPNTDDSFSNALLDAVHDTTNKPSVISISWGGSEDGSTTQFRNAFQSALEDAQQLGITVLLASGDNGAVDMQPVGQFAWDGKAHVDFPASSPLVLACGATHIDPSGTTLTGEAAWNQGFADTNPDRNTFGAVGGGISDVFTPPPSWQSNIAMPAAVNGGPPGRGVPDVTGNGDPASGYHVRVDGKNGVVGGTSAVAPLWAALTARINQILGRRVGFLNDILYKNSSAFNDVTLGNNRVSSANGNENLGYDATVGWDACTGLGSPKGQALLSVLKMTSLAAAAPPSGGPVAPAAQAGRVLKGGAAIQPQSDDNTDAAFIQDAYGDALKNQVQMLINNYIANTPNADQKFTDGLAIIRKARDRALVLVQN